MKLRNLLFGTMIACAFVACSNDDDPTPNQEEGQGVAKIIVNPDLLRGNLTKAAVDESVYDNYIVYVFDKSGNNLAHGVPGTEFDVANNPGAVDVMVVGNIGDALEGTETKSVVLEATKTFDAAEEAGETVKGGTSLSIETTSQNSHLYSFTLQSGLINKVGYDVAATGEVLLTSNKIQVYRNVAKIALNKITVSTKPIVVEGEDVVYSNPKLDVTRAFILNAQYSTKLAAIARWGTVFNNAAVMGSVDLAQFNTWMAEADGLKTATTLPYIPVTTPKTEATYKQHSTYNSETANIKGEITGSKTFTADNKFYVYESTDVADGTLLVIEGVFSYDNPSGVGRVVEHGYYTVVLGAGTLTASLDTDLFPGGATVDMGVRRNIQYNVNLTVKAPGSKNPLIPNSKVAALDTQIELVGYGNVSSDTDFE